jgi:hypothetical protein
MKGLRILTLEVFILAILFVLGGCGKNESPMGPEISSDDETALRTFVGDNPELFTFDFEDVSLESQNGTSDQTLLRDIDPVAFWREITQRGMEVDVHIVFPGGDTLPYAEVTVTGHIQGLFHTVTMDSHYTKEIDDTAVMYAYFEGRKPTESVNERPYRGWKLKKISGVEIASNPCTKEILSVKISSSSGLVDTTIADVSSLWDIKDLFVFQPGDSVTLTVDTGNPEDLVFLHAPFFFRRPFQHIGGGIFVGTWVTARDPHFARRWRHAFIDVIDHGSVFDDEMPYDSRAWGMVYFVGARLDLDEN